MRFAVIGNGSWGTALGRLLILNGHSVILYGIDEKITSEINDFHTLSRYFPNVTLPKELTSTGDLELALLDADVLLFTVPTFAMRSVASKVSDLLKRKVHIVTGAKGFEEGSHKRMSEVLRESIPGDLRYEIVSLIGPSHAEEVIEDQLTAVTATSLDQQEAELIQEAFSNNTFRVYTNSDEIGAEYAVAIKNTIAIASGILKGRGFGDNARAALITRGLAEMQRLGLKMGGKPETFLGLAGVGDLIVTCNSTHSRNFQAGLAIGKADSAKEFLKDNFTTVEGIKTAKTAYELAEIYQVEMPISESVYSILYQNKKPSDMALILMGRPLKSEDKS